jgi:hypothetical protein
MLPSGNCIHLLRINRDFSCVLTVHGVGVGGGFIMGMVFQKDVKDPVREDSLVVIYVVTSEVFWVYVKSFKRV